MGKPTRALGAAALAALATGCAMVPRSHLEDCHKRCQAQQAETAQWKDAALRHRDQNRDYAQRAVDDAKRIRDLEVAHARLEQSVASYEQDIARVEAAWDRVKRQVEAVAAAPADDHRGR